MPGRPREAPGRFGKSRESPGWPQEGSPRQSLGGFRKAPRGTGKHREVQEDPPGSVGRAQENSRRPREAPGGPRNALGGSGKPPGDFKCRTCAFARLSERACIALSAYPASAGCIRRCELSTRAPSLNASQAIRKPLPHRNGNLQVSKIPS